LPSHLMLLFNLNLRVLRFEKLARVPAHALPSILAHRTNTGFSPPATRRGRGEWWDRAESSLAGGQVRSARGRARVRATWVAERSRRGEEDDGWRPWRVEAVRRGADPSGGVPTGEGRDGTVRGGPRVVVEVAWGS